MVERNFKKRTNKQLCQKIEKDLINKKKSHPLEDIYTKFKQASNNKRIEKGINQLNPTITNKKKPIYQYIIAKLRYFTNDNFDNKIY